MATQSTVLPPGNRIQITRRTKGDKFHLERVLLYLALIGLSVLFLFPFFWTVTSSLKQIDELYLFPPTFFPESPQWVNYQKVLQAVPFLRWALNSLIVVILSTSGTVLTATLAAYAFAQFRSRLAGYRPTRRKLRSYQQFVRTGGVPMQNLNLPHQLSRRDLLKWLGVGSATVALAACAPAAAPGAAPQSESAAAPAGDKPMMTVATFDAPLHDWQREFAKRWADAHTDIDVQIESVVYAEMNKLQLARSASGTLWDADPDLAVDLLVYLPSEEAGTWSALEQGTGQPNARHSVWGNEDLLSKSHPIFRLFARICTNRATCPRNLLISLGKLACRFFPFTDRIKGIVHLCGKQPSKLQSWLNEHFFCYAFTDVACIITHH